MLVTSAVDDAVEMICAWAEAANRDPTTAKGAARSARCFNFFKIKSPPFYRTQKRRNAIRIGTMRRTQITASIICCSYVIVLGAFANASK